jgi:adenylate cyclase
MSQTGIRKSWVERQNGERHDITGSCSVGRAPFNHIVVTDDRASRRHALINLQGEHEHWLVDLGSSNGTLLNGRRVSRPTRLVHGDRIDIGSTVLFYRESDVPVGAVNGGTTDSPTILELRCEPCWMLVADIEGSTSLHVKFQPDQIPVLIGEWLSESKQLIEEHGGSINKFLGDGFFAYWQGRSGSLRQICDALQTLKRFQQGSSLPFRFVLHHGEAYLGGISLGEESLSGKEVNFVFRMEKLAAQLGCSRLLSAAAASFLENELPLQPTEQLPVPGFEGLHAFVTF